MTKYAATFKDGKEITRTSKRKYTHAWRLVGKVERFGFSNGKENAEKAARADAGFYCYQNDKNSKEYKLMMKGFGVRRIPKVKVHDYSIEITEAFVV